MTHENHIKFKCWGPQIGLCWNTDTLAWTVCLWLLPLMKAELSGCNPSMSQSLKMLSGSFQKKLADPEYICNTGVSKNVSDLHNTWGLPHTQWKQQWCSRLFEKNRPGSSDSYPPTYQLRGIANPQCSFQFLNAQRCRVLTKLNLSCRLLSKHHPVLWWQHKTHQTPQTAAPTAFWTQTPESQRNTNGVSRLPAWKPPWG